MSSSYELSVDGKRGNLSCSSVGTDETATGTLRHGEGNTAERKCRKGYGARRDQPRKRCPGRPKKNRVNGGARPNAGRPPGYLVRKPTVQERAERLWLEVSRGGKCPPRRKAFLEQVVARYNTDDIVFMRNLVPRGKESVMNEMYQILGYQN